VGTVRRSNKPSSPRASRPPICIRLGSPLRIVQGGGATFAFHLPEQGGLSHLWVPGCILQWFREFVHHIPTHYSYGVWVSDHSERSSNYRELNNLVSSIEQHLSDGTFIGAEIYVFTENFTAESAFYKGNTSSKALFDLVLRLCTL
jgi:hypothetical protein